MAAETYEHTAIQQGKRRTLVLVAWNEVYAACGQSFAYVDWPAG
jgi:hypothetical protein